MSRYYKLCPFGLSMCPFFGNFSFFFLDYVILLKILYYNWSNFFSGSKLLSFGFLFVFCSFSFSLSNTAVSVIFIFFKSNAQLN